MFGINAACEDRIIYQKSVTCSVIDVDDLREDVLVNHTDSLTNWLYFHLGIVFEGAEKESNITYPFFEDPIRGQIGYMIQ